MLHYRYYILQELKTLKSFKINIEILIKGVVTEIVIEKRKSQFSIIFVLASQYRSHSAPLDNAVRRPRWFLSMVSWRLHSMQ